MTSQETLILTNRIKQTIQKHYKNMPQKQLAHKVRTQIIPILISLFFQQNRKSAHGNILIENNSNIVNGLQSRLTQSDQMRYTFGSGKQNYFTQSKGYNDKLENYGINLEQFIKNNEQNSLGIIITKTFSLCKLVNLLQKLQKKPGNTGQIFRIYKQKKQKSKRLIKWLQKYSKITSIRYCLSKFHYNLYVNRNRKQACKTLHKLYVIKLYNYYSQFINNLSQTSIVDTSTSKQSIYRSLLLKSGLNKLQTIYEKGLRKAVHRIKHYNLKNNRWMVEWVRNIAYRTPANLQTSFWRLKNFVANQVKNPQKLQQKLEIQQNISFGKNSNKVIEQSVGQLFTKNQKTQILCGLLQLVEKQKYFAFVSEAFTAIELHAYSPSVICPNKGQQQQLIFIRSKQLVQQIIQSLLVLNKPNSPNQTNQ